MAHCSIAPLPWMAFRSPASSASALKGTILASANPMQENSAIRMYSDENLHEKQPIMVSKGLISANREAQQVDSFSKKYPQELLHYGVMDLAPTGAILRQGDQHLEQSVIQKGVSLITREQQEEISVVPYSDGLNSVAAGKESGAKAIGKVRKRPARIVVPQIDQNFGFDEVGLSAGEVEFQVEGRDFCLASKKGGRKVMEDGYGVITDICGNSKQAFFGVFDGHGGCAAVDYVAEKLGKNIITAIEESEKSENQLEQAIEEGYLTTDKEFLSQGERGGTCAATVLVNDGELLVSNVGDCRVVLSRKGIADQLTKDHRVNREDERFRIESSGGFVSCCNGVWRVQGSLSVSRAIGDVYLKEWVISEPETNKLRLTSDCDFLVMASDGLWDKVTNQEAVDVVLRYKNSVESCKKLVDISSSRGCKDDITVMVINLKKFYS